eukprot:m.3707 g.3707  ORF g.3707 m.3707 type:complete len:102 (+) comp3711_c0_seq1:162-467(+)
MKEICILEILGNFNWGTRMEEENNAEENSQLPEEVAMALERDEKQQAQLLLNPSFPTRDYLDSSVVPVLLEGLVALSKERPPNPVEWLGTYLLKQSQDNKQ